MLDFVVTRPSRLSPKFPSVQRLLVSFRHGTTNSRVSGHTTFQPHPSIGAQGKIRGPSAQGFGGDIKGSKYNLQPLMQLFFDGLDQPENVWNYTFWTYHISDHPSIESQDEDFVGQV